MAAEPKFAAALNQGLGIKAHFKIEKGMSKDEIAEVKERKARHQRELLELVGTDKLKTALIEHGYAPAEADIKVKTFDDGKLGSERDTFNKDGSVAGRGSAYAIAVETAAKAEGIGTLRATKKGMPGGPGY